jgi:hypothetical protein
MIDELEDELARAMAAEVADLPAPRLDLHRMQSHRPVGRKLLVPGVAVGVAVAVAAPMAAAHTGPFHTAPAANAKLDVSASAGATLPTGVPTGVLPSVSVPVPVPSVSLPSVPGVLPLPSVPVPSSLPDACQAVRRALSADEYAAAVRKVRAAVADLAAKQLGVASGRVLAPLTEADLRGLLPPSGALVTYVDCSLAQVPDADQRAAAIAEVRRAVSDAQAMVLAAKAGITRALGNGVVPGWLGDFGIHLVSRTESTMVLNVVLGTPLPQFPASGSLTVTYRLTDHSVVNIRPLGLKLPPHLPVPQLPVPLPTVPIPVPLPSLAPGLGLPTGGR